MKHKTINGWTKELMKAQIRLNMRAKSNRYTESGQQVCLYRSQYKGKPTACSVGCFIPDELFLKEHNAKACPDLITAIPQLTKRLPLQLLGLCDLQFAHDGFTGPGADCAEHVCKWIDENVEDGE